MANKLKDLAVVLHDSFCRDNHTDDCAWGYETEESRENERWQMKAHRRWLNIATDFLRDHDKLLVGALDEKPSRTISMDDVTARIRNALNHVDGERIAGIHNLLIDDGKVIYLGDGLFEESGD